MAGDIDTVAGVPAQLALTAVDGATGLYPRATVFNGNASPVPVAAVNLSHLALGLYRAEVLLTKPGVYRAVYRNFLDAGRTVLDKSRDQDQDTIVVRPLDEPRLGVVYDDVADVLGAEISVSRDGVPMAQAQLTSAVFEVYDGDDNLVIAVSDLVPDTLGVFRVSKSAPGLVADRLYYVRVTVTTTDSGTVTASKGFQTTE